MLRTMKGSAEREKLVANAAPQANTDWPDWLTDRPDLTWPDWLIDRRTDWLTWCVLTGHWTNELCELVPWSMGDRKNRSNVWLTSIGTVLELFCHSFGTILYRHPTCVHICIYTCCNPANKRSHKKFRHHISKCYENNEGLSREGKASCTCRSLN